MIRFLPYILIAAGSFGFFKHYSNLHDRLDRAERERAAFQDQVKRATEAAAVHRAHIARVEQDRKVLQTTIIELQQMEGRDAPLSPLLRATADRLYGAGQ